MQIIWNKSVADQLKKTHTVLELETFEVNGDPVVTYCVVPVEAIGTEGFATLDRYKDIHHAFITAYNEKNYKLCLDAAEHLMGQFGGELDSFYEEITKRIR
jgi:hypothetical protein